MKAKVNIKYRDKNDGKVHEVGEEVTVNKARFAEIDENLPGCLTDASADGKPGGDEHEGPEAPAGGDEAEKPEPAGGE